MAQCLQLYDHMVTKQNNVVVHRNIEVVDLQTEEKYVFIAMRWLAVEMEDGQVDICLPVCGQTEMKDFQYLFVNKTRRDLTDSHLWFSIYGRPPRSTFTRCERLSVAISLLFTHMVANLMFYGALPPGTPKTENKVAGFTINFQQVGEISNSENTYLLKH